MKLNSVSAIVEALNDAKVRYLVVGGLAVGTHGYLRFTNDVDLVIQLDPDNVRRAFETLEGLGYRPGVPVTAQQFADADKRKRWVREKDMKVLSFRSDKHRETPVNLLVEEPFDFDREYEAAIRRPLFDHLDVRVVALTTLIKMKEAAVRTGDKIDVEYLRMRLNDHEGTDSPRDEQGFDWSLTTWDGNRREQMRHWAQLSLEEVISAHEGMEKVIKVLQSGVRSAGKRK